MIGYMPKQGDVVELDFNPLQRTKRGRVALVVSNDKYYQKCRQLVVCNIKQPTKFLGHLKAGDLNKAMQCLTATIKTIDPETKPVLCIDKVPECVIDPVRLAMNSFF